MKISRPVLVNTSLGVVIAGAIAASLLILLPAQASSSTEVTQLTSTVQQGVVSSTITASGAVAAVREVAADFAVSGTIASVDVALGATVTAGQQLGTLDATELDKAVASASTALTRAKTDLATANAAVTSATTDASSPDPQTASSAAEKLTSAKSQVLDAKDKVADANDVLAAAQTDRANATLVSPIAGLVVAVTGTVGSSSGSSTASTSAAGGTTTTSSGFVTIADVTAMTMTAAIAEADIALVAVGQTATVTFPALEDVTATATVTSIAPTGTTSNSVVTYSTTITLDAIPEGLRLGQTAEVTITTVASADDALYVPTAAITSATDGTSTVDVIGDDDEVTTTTVELGVVGDAGTVVTSGLTAGQTIVLGEVAATSGSDADTGTTDQRGQFGGGTGGFTPPAGGTFPGGN